MEKQAIWDFIDTQRRLGNTRLIGLSFSGTDLSGVELSECALPGVDLSGTDLSGAVVTRVDFSRANLTGARLEGARLHMVDAPGAYLTGLQASGAHFEHVSLNQADLSRANLNKTLFDGCNLESAVMDGTLLQNGQLVYSNCRGASFREANLDHLATIGSIFTNANFHASKNFYSSPEIVMEVIRQEAGESFELIMASAAVCIDRKSGFAKWREYLIKHPKQYDFIRRIFAGYPGSGCLEALSSND